MVDYCVGPHERADPCGEFAHLHQLAVAFDLGGPDHAPARQFLGKYMAANTGLRAMITIAPGAAAWIIEPST